MKANNWRNRLCIWAVVVCMTLAYLPAAVLGTEHEGSDPNTGDFAIPEDAVRLSSPEDILALAENCISDAWSRDKVIVLENDIDLTGVEFFSIPTFGGTFLGQGHTISGVQLTGEVTALGFFRYLQTTAVVENLHLNGIVQPSGSGNQDIGGIVGVNSGRVQNCSFTGTASGTERVGGIAGRNKVSGIIDGCRVSGMVYGDHYIGGIAGENLGVIRTCVNTAQVNTQVDHNSISAMMPGVSLEGLIARESISDATNIGGIAGTSSGVIRSCENRANVGYEKMGYNVGGIAGSQIGYITECANYGTINGSNGVGGIVGQFKPNVVLNMGQNHVGELTEQSIEMMDTMSGMMSSMQGMMWDMSYYMDSMNDSMDLLRNPESLDPDTINAAVNGMSSSFNGMYQSMVGSGSEAMGQMNSMMGTMSDMMETMEILNQGLNIKIIDISKEDTPENTQTKVSVCANYGSIFGESNVGGIAGIADIEDTAAQGDIQGQLHFSTEGEMIMRLVIRDCRNLGTISASKAYAGGIVGLMRIGAVFGGRNTGAVDALQADYVGGIAGSSESYIFGSINRAVLAGNNYVGGIAGCGTEVVGCFALTNIAAANKYAGGILGDARTLPDEEPGKILENRYYLTGKNLGGIDGICYDGATAPMTIEEFLDVVMLDDMFRTVTVRFVVQGQEDVVLTVELGQSIAIETIPQPEAGDREQYQWVLHQSVTSETLGLGESAAVQYISRERLTNILFDQTYEAVFDAKNMVVASREKTATGRSLALAVGTFDRDTTLHLTNITAQEPTVNGVTVLENWEVSMADIGIEKLHYHIPEGVDAARIVLYVRDSSGNWAQRSFTVEGSYMIFSFAHEESGFALEVLPEEKLSIVAIGIAAGAGIVLIVAVRSIKTRKTKKTTATA